MSPDDNLFDGKAPEGSEETPEETPVEKTAERSLSVSDVQSMLDSQAETLRGEHQQENQKLQAEVTRLTQAQAVVPEVEDQSADEFIEAFTNDPKKAIEKISKDAQQAQLENVLPFLRQQNNTMHITLIAAEKAAIELEYGKGSWDTHFAPIIDLRMANIRETNERGLSDANLIKNEVLGVMGLKRDTLAKLKIDNTAAGIKTKEDERTELMSSFNTAGMTGGTGSPPVKSDAPITDEEAAFIESKRLAGQTVDIKKLRDRISNPSLSFNDWTTKRDAEDKPKKGATA